MGYVSSFAGAHSQGETLDELNKNLKEVIAMLLEDGDPEAERGHDETSSPLSRRRRLLGCCMSQPTRLHQSGQHEAGSDCQYQGGHRGIYPFAPGRWAAGTGRTFRCATRNHMSGLPRISGRDCTRALGKVGFYLKRQQSSHMILRRDNPSLRSLSPIIKSWTGGPYAPSSARLISAWRSL